MSERADAPRSGGRTTARAGTARRTPAAPARETSTGSSVRGASGSSARGSSITGRGSRDARGARRLSTSEPAATEGTAALALEVKAIPAEGSPRLRVAPPAPISAPRAPFVAVVISLVVVGVLGILVINTKTNENSFRITKLQDQQASLNAQEQELNNQIAEYETPNYLNAAARRLGLVTTTNLAYLRLPDGRIIGVPKPGEGQPAVTSQDGATPAAPTTPAGTTATGTTGTGATANDTTGTGTTANGTGAGTTATGGSGAQDGAVSNGTGQ